MVDISSAVTIYSLQMVSLCHAVLLAVITTEYAVGNDTDPGKYATMKHRVKSVTCRAVKSVWAIKSVDDEKGEVTRMLLGLKRRACQGSDNTTRIVRGF